MQKTPKLNKIKEKRRRAFVLEYAAAGFDNATATAIRAGYSKVSARTTGSRLIKSPEIIDAIQEQRERFEDVAESALIATADEIARELTTLALQKPNDFLEWDGATLRLKSFDEIDVARIGAIKTIRQTVTKEGQGLYEVQFWDKPKALESLARIKGMLTDVDIGLSVSFSINGFSKKAEEENEE